MIVAPTGSIPQALVAGTAAPAGIDPRPDGLLPLTIPRTRAERGFPDERAAILAAWAERGITAVGCARCAWTISPRLDGGGAAYVGSPSTWRAWRPRDAEALREGENRATFESRLLEPLVLASTVDELARLVEAGGPSGDLARRPRVLRAMPRRLPPGHDRDPRRRGRVPPGRDARRRGGGLLPTRMRAFLEAWRPAFVERFPGGPAGGSPDPGRIRAGSRPRPAARRWLGRAVGRLKHVRDQPITGFVVDLTSDT